MQLLELTPQQARPPRGRSNTPVFLPISVESPGHNQRRQARQIVQAIPEAQQPGVATASRPSAVVLGCPTRLPSLYSGFRIIPLNWVELWEFEPQTSCIPYSGNTSTRVHRRRSPSQDVRISPPESRPVAILSCCTARASPPLREPRTHGRTTAAEAQRRRVLPTECLGSPVTRAFYPSAEMIAFRLCQACSGALPAN
jgi:hypothetical protein